VLLLVDFINPMEFPGAERLAPRAEQAARATAQLKARMTRAGAAAIYANDNYGHWRSAFHDVLGRCMEASGRSRRIAQLLKPTPEDLVILKPRQSAFYGTALDLLLAQMRTRNLVLAGLATDICVQLTAMDASLRGYNLWVPSDCTASESASLERASLRYMKRVLKAHTQRAGRIPRHQSDHAQ
jgi:nicotinamidase-related amidase